MSVFTKNKSGGQSVLLLFAFVLPDLLDKRARSLHVETFSPDPRRLQTLEMDSLEATCCTRALDQVSVFLSSK